MNHLNAHKYRLSSYLRAYKAPSTTVENPLQIDLFLQNKPNFQIAKMSVSFFYTTNYENICNWTLGENKPNQTQFLERLNVNLLAAVYYGRKPAFAIRKVRPNSQILEFFTAEIFERGSSHQADKIALKIYPFGIDYPIVLKEILRKMRKNVILSGASAQRRISFCA